MDDVLRRRLTGALVLLGLAFALAALLPDTHRPVRSTDGGQQVVTYDLSTGLPVAEQPRQSATPDAAATPEPPRTALQLQESLALSPADSWYVQVGSFEDPVNARSVLVKLYQLGMPTAIQSVQVKKDLWYRVRVGPYALESKARDALVAIRQQGYREAKLVHAGG